MALEITETYARPSRVPFLNMRWSAIFAGLAVGISANLFLLLVGGAAGLAMFNTSAQPSDTSVAIAASVWNTIAMLVGAFVGGYVAARASGMRRTQDGILHGAVAWGVTMVLSALLAGSAAGSTLSGMFSTVANKAGPESASVSKSVARSVESGDREAAVRSLQSSLGLTPDQAGKIVDQALIMSGRSESASEQGRADARDTAKTASMATGWLSAAILLSLLAAMGGGMLGARATRRLGGRELRREIVRTDSPSGTIPRTE